MDKFTNEMFFEKNGFNSNGIGYAIAGNTFEVKDSLKEIGAKFNGYTKCWICPKEIFRSGFEAIKVYVEDLFNKDVNGIFQYYSPKLDNCEKLKKDISDLSNRLETEKNSKNPSRFIGNIGDKITIAVKEGKYITTYYNDFGSVNVYHFLDSNDNVFVWRTGASIKPEDVKEISGTIAYHNEFKGIQQNILNRCKVKYA